MAEYLYYTDCHHYVMWKQNKSSLRVINQASYIMNEAKMYRFNPVTTQINKFTHWKIGSQKQNNGYARKNPP